MQVMGRDFSEDILCRIRTRVQGEPELTRSALSREVCDWMQWHAPDGRPKEVGCRVALLKLARRGLIELPEPKAVSFGKPSPGALAAATPQMSAASATAAATAAATTAIRATLHQLGPVWLQAVDAGQPELSRTWWSLIRQHHPLGVKSLCGAQLRYLIRCEQGVLGALSFSAAAWRLAARAARPLARR